MADDRLNPGGDDLDALLEQLGEMQNLDFNVDSLSEFDLAEIGNNLSEDELDMLLLDNEINDFTESDTNEIDQLMKKLEVKSEDDEEEEQEDQETASDTASDEEAVKARAVPSAVEPEELDEAENDRILAELLGDVDGGVIEREAAEVADTGVSDISELSGVSEIPGVPTQPDMPDASDFSDISDILDMGNMGGMPDSPAPSVEEETPEDYVDQDDAAAMEFLSGLGDFPDSSEGEEGAATGEDLFDSVSGGIGRGGGDDSYDEDIDLPDFSFNESFTTMGDGRAEVVKSRDAVRRDRQEEPRKSKRKRKQRKKFNVVKFVSEKVPEPVKAKLEPVITKLSRKKGPKQKMSQTRKLVVTIVVMVIALAASSMLLVSQYRKARRIVEDNSVIVKTPVSKLNYANYVFTDNSRPLNGKGLTLGRLQLDEYMCVFYFDQYIPLDKCFAELRDDLGNYYGIYRALTETKRSRDEEEPAILWFEGIKEGAGQLYLTIWDSETKDSAEYHIDISDYEPLPAKYLTSPKGTRTEDGSYSVTIEEAAFSSAMSTVVYKIEERPGVDVAQGLPDDTLRNGHVILENTESSASALLNEPLIYTVNDDIKVVRMDFFPVKSLSNKARITFRDWYRYVTLNKSFNAAPLFDLQQGEEMRIEAGKGFLVLEGMKKFNNLFVLVYHFEDGEGERIYGNVDVAMTVRTYTGLEVELSSYARYKLEGGDIIFEYEEPNSIIDNSEPENIYIEIKSVMLNMSPIVSDIILSREADSASDTDYAPVKAFVKEAFSRRLSTKHSDGESGNGLSRYFEGHILSDDALAQLYRPRNTTMPPEYSVVIRAFARLSRFEYFAVVEESWLGVIADDKIHEYNTHKIIIKQIGDNFVITSDELETD